MNPGPAKIRYVARLENVNEVSLQGVADLDYWNGVLQSENLRADAQDGHARLLIVAAAAKFKGLRFCEISFSVLVEDKHRKPSQETAFLVQAFNSRRAFAFCERVFFHTPYYFADCHCSAVPAATIQLGSKSADHFWAHMPDGPGANRQPLSTGAGSWNGAVLLPAGGKERRRLFFADIQGATDTYRFESADQLTMHAAPNAPVVEMLIESQFRATHWVVRRSAMHAKSKTYFGDDGGA